MIRKLKETTKDSVENSFIAWRKRYSIAPFLVEDQLAFLDQFQFLVKAIELTSSAQDFLSENTAQEIYERSEFEKQNG